MSVQNLSEAQKPAPGLYLVATPIGNLEDISLRALRVLRGVDLIACEDTRHTARLLDHFGIRRKCESHHEHNELQHTRRLISLLKSGASVALVSDAGTPLLSDPGYALVEECRKSGIDVFPVPGPSAAVAALVASGLPTDSFYFAGFLPPKSGLRKRKLQELAAIPGTLVFYEAPHRILAALQDMIQILGDREACLARELTKMHEEWLRGTLATILNDLQGRRQVRGEITLVVDRGTAALPAAHSWPDSIRRHLEEEAAKTGVTQKEALKAVARKRGISRRDAYRQLVKESDE